MILHRNIYMIYLFLFILSLSLGFVFAFQEGPILHFATMQFYTRVRIRTHSHSHSLLLFVFLSRLKAMATSEAPLKSCKLLNVVVLFLIRCFYVYIVHAFLFTLFSSTLCLFHIHLRSLANCESQFATYAHKHTNTHTSTASVCKGMNS